MSVKNVTSWLVSIVLVGFLFAFTGCGTASQFRDNGLPAKKYLVGGGFKIYWTAPVNGTAHVVEETASRIVQSEYLEKGEVFEVSIDLPPEEFEEMFDMPMGDAKFSLYFIPSDLASN